MARSNFYNTPNHTSVLLPGKTVADRKLVILNDNYPSYLLSILRDKNTGIHEFRSTMSRLGEYIAIEIINRDEYLKNSVETPLGTAEYKKPLHIDNTIIIGILRAALPLVEGMMKVFRKARVGFVGARRVEEDSGKGQKEFDVIMNYYNIPSIRGSELIIVADPMLATASTMIRVLNLLKPKLNEDNKVVIASVIAARYGVERLFAMHPYVTLYTTAVDPILNDNGYIVPGLGDAGDRSFG